MSLPTKSFQELLARAKILAAARKEEENVAAINMVEHTLERERPDVVDLSLAGIDSSSLYTEDGMEAAVDVVGEIVSARSPAEIIPIDLHTKQISAAQKQELTGVAADVSLNSKQALFGTTALSGEDVCLIGAAGTGKTTGTGKFIQALIANGTLEYLGTDTKWLRASVYGVLVTSFTRKAVNNIRRAVPEELKPHVLTLHKVLEFSPVFYEIEDTKTGLMKKTMRFEPQRTATNPLPSKLSLIIFEESSMIGTDLYNLLSAALPHNPQEIFIGDIRQLPPIFGPAILGFKMSLLPVIELTEVYRQALLSPIIRLAHAVLNSDSKKFDTEGKYTEREEHPFEIDPKTGKKKIVERIHIPKLEAFNEEGEHGSVKMQIWQKTLPSEMAVDVTIKQFIAWEKNGYYNPEEDIILCPFNKSFGTVELNKGIQQYLGIKRKAVVYEVISGFEKQYLAVGDRVLFDKEDAVIIDIRRNLTYMGTSPQPHSLYLDRWGALQKPLTEEEQMAQLQEEQGFSEAAMNKFLETFSGEEEDSRVNSASHVVDIQFTYSDEKLTLSSAGEINSLLGGNALTVHKMQGSEADTVFLVFHKSHAAMVNNELLYTGLTRARRKLHVICEIDTFFKGVKTHKVRGITLADKIEFFKGKVEFKEMQQEMEFLQQLRDKKKKDLEEKKLRDERVMREMIDGRAVYLGIENDSKNPFNTHDDDHFEVDEEQIAYYQQQEQEKEQQENEANLIDYTTLEYSEYPDTLETLDSVQDRNSTPQKEEEPEVRKLSPLQEKLRLLQAKMRMQAGR